MSDTPNPPLTPIQTGGKAVHGVQIYDTNGNPIVSFGGSGGTAQNDQTAFTVGASALTPVGGLYEAAPTAVPTGDVGVIGITAKRSVKTTLYSSAGVEIVSFGGGTQYTKGNTDTAAIGTVAMTEGPTNVINPLQADANKDLKVLLITGQAGLAGGAGAVGANTQRTTLASDDPAVAVLGAITGAAIITDVDGTIQRYLRGLIKLAITVGGWLVTASGDVAHDGVDSGNPVKVGGKAATALPAVVSAGDRTNLLTDVYGRPFIRTATQGPSGAYTHSQHNPAANTKATKTVAAAGAGVRNICTSLSVALAGGATAPAAIQLTVALIDGAAGGTTYLWGPNVISIPAVAGAMAAFVIGQCFKPGTANTAMTLEFSAAGGANTIESVEFDSCTAAE